MNFKKTLSAAVAAALAAGTMGALSLTAFADTTVTTAADLRTVVAAGGTVTLGADINLGTEREDTLTIAEGTTVTIDLGDYAIKLDSQTREYVNDWDETDYAGYNAIINYGNLTLNGGSIVGSWNGMSNEAGATLQVNGTKISTTGPWQGIWNGGTLTINGGTFTGTAYGIYNSDSGDVTINDGAFSGDYEGLCNDGTVNIYNYNGSVENYGTIKFQGGTINGSITTNYGTLTIGDDIVIFESMPSGLTGNVENAKEKYDATYSVDGDTLTITGTYMKDFGSASSAPWYSARNGIKNVVIADGVKNIGNCAFKDWQDLETVTIAASVESIGTEAFYKYSSKISSVTFGENSQLKTIGNKAFYKAIITSLDIPEGVTSIGSETFAYSTLESVTFPSTLTSIGEKAFQGCNKLTAVDLSNTKLTEIAANTFSNCAALETVKLPSTITTLGNNSFYYCAALKSINLEDTKLESIGNLVFNQTTALTEVEFPDTLESIGTSAFSGSGLTSVVLPDSVTSVGGSAFINNKALTSITLSSGLETIGTNAFMSSGVTEIEIPSSVTSIGQNAFNNCDSLTTVVIDEGVTSIGEKAFADCKVLETVTVPASVTTVGANAFAEDQKKTSEKTTIIYKGTNSSVIEALEANETAGKSTSVAKAEATATIDKVAAVQEGDDPVGATGFLTTINGSNGASVKSVTWTVTSGGKAYVFTPSNFTTLTLDGDAQATVALIIDGLYDASATAAAGVY